MNLTFTSWAPAMAPIAELWNAKHPEIQVEVQAGPSGSAGTYQNFFNEIKAGNAPDLGQIEYDALPSFRVNDGLENIAACGPIADAEEHFVDWTWSQVTFGEEDAVYAVPQDTGPLVMYYRKDLFQKAGIPVPTTWEEYAQAAAEVKAKGAYISNFSKTNINWFVGMVWQHGGQWFENDGSEWSVDLTDEESTAVADYWQNLIDNGEVSTLASFSDTWVKSFVDGQQWTWIAAPWSADTLATGVPTTAGKWAVAPMPQWASGGEQAGNWGGSSTAVLKGSEHPYEAAKFAMWLNTDPEALALANELGVLYPAAKAGAADFKASTRIQDFFGGQPIHDVFEEASGQVNPDLIWGPTMTQTYTDVSDGFGVALDGTGTLAEALEIAQQETIDALKAQGIPVHE